MDREKLIEMLSAAKAEERRSAVRELKKLLGSGEIKPPAREGYTNNHVHTTYSFSPYSPAKAVWTAFMSGLSTVGIMDHDAILGAEEFIEAGRILGIATTIGFEMRTDWSATPLIGKRINNPDQITNAYISAHGLPHSNIKAADRFLSNIRTERGKRNRAMVKKLNDCIQIPDIAIDYDKDVLPLSVFHEGGEVTERHLLFSLTKKLIGKYGRGPELISALTDGFHLEFSPKQSELLSDAGIQGEVYAYDLLNVLKGSFIKKIYVDAAGGETPPVREAVDFIKSVGAIPSYCYLGDVGESPTGDKKAQKFEDDYLEELLHTCKQIGFQAIAYMPSRNTLPQLVRVQELCAKLGFMQISGEDINQPRQSFICKQLKMPGFEHLIDTTWALVGHEISATREIKAGMFADNIPLGQGEMNERIGKYKSIGLMEYESAD